MRCAVAAVVLALFASGWARADAPVKTRVDPCVPFDHEQFQRLLALELGTDSDSLDETASAGRAVVSLTCVEDGVQLRLDDPVTRKTMTRVVDVAHVDPASRSRLMSLTVAEFVVASWLELRLSQRERLDPVGPPPPPAIEQRAAELVEERAPAPVAEPQASSSTQLLAAVEVASFFSEFEPIPGGALRVLHQFAPAPALAFVAGLQIGLGNFDGVLGDQRERVTVHLTTLSLLAGVLYAARAGDFELTAGAGARLGFVGLEGSRTVDPRVDPATAYVPWGGPVALLGLGYRASRELRVSLQLEAGFMRHIRASALGRDVVVDLRNGWAGVSLGLGWALGGY